MLSAWGRVWATKGGEDMSDGTRNVLFVAAMAICCPFAEGRYLDIGLRLVPSTSKGNETANS